MKIKLKELVNCVSAFQEIADMKLSAMLAFKVSKLLKVVNTELLAFDEIRNKKREDITEIKDDKKIIPPDKFMELEKELNELLNSDIEIDFTPLNISDFEKYDIKPAVLLALDKFFV